MLQGSPGKPLSFRWTIGSGASDLFVRAYVYDADDVLIGTEDLPHVAFGTYRSEAAFAEPGNYTVIFVPYTDATYTEVSRCAPLVAEDYIIVPDVVSYSGRMTTVFNTETCEHEVLVWLDCNDQRQVGTENAVIEIKNSAGGIVYTDTLATPNADGVFRFLNEFNTVADQNYYVVIHIDLDGSTYTSHQSFFTMG